MTIDAEYYLSMRWEHKIKQRYYHIRLAKDLFDQWVVTKSWGGIAKSGGRICHVACDSYQSALSMVNDLSKQRKRRGYVFCIPT